MQALNRMIISVSHGVMEPHGQSPWYLHEIPLLRQGFGGLSASGEIRRSINIAAMNDPTKAYAFIHRQSPCLHAEVFAFAETFRAGVPTSRRGLLHRLIKWIYCQNLLIR